MFAHILLPSDGSAGALRAAVAAAEIAKRFGSRLTIVTVSHPPPAITPQETPAGYQIERDILDEIQQRILGAIRHIVDGVNVASEECQRYGNPAERITEVAEQEHCDLIVLGSRGMGGVQSCLLGSVSLRVAHMALALLAFWAGSQMRWW